MPYRRPDGKALLTFAVQPDFAAALKEYAESSKVSMTHVAISAIARKLKGAGYWPRFTPATLEDIKRRRIDAMVAGRQRQREEAKAGTASTPRLTRRKRRQHPPGGRSIGGRAPGRSIRTRAKRDGLYF